MNVFPPVADGDTHSLLTLHDERSNISASVGKLSILSFSTWLFYSHTSHLLTVYSFK